MVKYPPFNFFRVIFYSLDELDERMVIYMAMMDERDIKKTQEEIEEILKKNHPSGCLYNENQIKNIAHNLAIFEQIIKDQEGAE